MKSAKAKSSGRVIFILSPRPSTKILSKPAYSIAEDSSVISMLFFCACEMAPIN